MLTSLHIQDVVLIEQARLPLATGLTALTGETGAGKSILLDALGLALGARAERGLVRSGAERGVVIATFEPPTHHPVWALLADNDLSFDDEHIILRRVQAANGKSRAFINDQPVSIGLLRETGNCLMEIHGQHDGQGFLSPASHRTLLDNFAGLDEERNALTAIWREWQAVQALLKEQLESQSRAGAEVDYLEHILAELEALAPQEGEEEQLANERTQLMAVEKVKERLMAAVAAIGNDADDERYHLAARHLAQADAAFDDKDHPIHQAMQSVDLAMSHMAEARAQVEGLAQAMEGDPQRLEQVEDRLFTLRAAARKHGIGCDALPDYLQKTRASLEAVQQGAEGLDELRQRDAALKKRFDTAAKKISGKRKKAGKELDRRVAQELAPLKLERAIFTTGIASDPDAVTQYGIDTVEFMVATNPGAPAGPLRAIASGGELSRFVLAMKAALAAKESRTVIIFDEIDAGVGGAVADAVGERLARLAIDAQVLVVTHSPQVAARADWHWRVEKQQQKNDTATHVRVLDKAERVEELARMLSGADVTPQARSAAKALLAPSGVPRTGKARRAS